MVFDFNVKLYIYVFAFFCDILVLNVCLKNGLFKICFRQSAKCKMTAQTGRKYHVFVNICNLECILKTKRGFVSSDPFCVFSAQLIHSRGGMFPVYTIYIQYILYILYNRSTISKFSQIQSIQEIT